SLFSRLSLVIRIALSSIKIVVCVFAALFSYQFALGQGYRLSGLVTDGIGNPVADADVTLQETGSRVTTDQYGLFSFAGLATGNYRIDVRKAGYGHQRVGATLYPDGQRGQWVTIQLD